jgi:biofilm PGA synthesis N-glycosyltransferase PgaC
MSMAEVSKYAFIISLGILFYTYFGYGLLAAIVGLFRKRTIYNPADGFQTSLTIIIPAYNEAGILQDKIHNTFKALQNFQNFQVILITDGSNDGSDLLKFTHPHILHLHEAERKGKSSAINRAMEFSTGEIVVITDANALINPEAFERLVVRFKNKKTGAVSGEKKVTTTDGSAGSEGFYWRYESFLKKQSARMYSLTGAAGELLAFRRHLFQPIPANAILDDMELSLSIIKQGKVIDYEPGAYATEPPSTSIQNEFKRKVRISAGVFQTLKRNPFVFNPFKHVVFVFQFNSHRVFRWTKGIYCILLLFVSNIFLLGNPALGYQYLFFDVFFALQSIFYVLVCIGFIFRTNRKMPSLLFIPFYFIMMNTAVLVGFFRFLRGKETVLWSKPSR